MFHEVCHALLVRYRTTVSLNAQHDHAPSNSDCHGSQGSSETGSRGHGTDVGASEISSASPAHGTYLSDTIRAKLSRILRLHANFFF
jgi:hypothetical protein